MKSLCSPAFWAGTQPYFNVVFWRRKKVTTSSTQYRRRINVVLQTLVLRRSINVVSTWIYKRYTNVNQSINVDSMISTLFRRSESNVDSIWNSQTFLTSEGTSVSTLSRRLCPLILYSHLAVHFNFIFVILTSCCVLLKLMKSCWINFKIEFLMAVVTPNIFRWAIMNALYC